MKKIFKNLISGITALSLFISITGVMPVSAVDSVFGGGDGTKENPYIISTAEQLKQLALDVDNGNQYTDKYFEMTNNIELLNNDGTQIEWESIGTISEFKGFAGIFDGNGYKIDGLFQNINSPSSTSSGSSNNGDFGGGLFALNLGTIKNLIVKGNVNVYGTDDGERVGGIVSYNAGVVENCSYEGTISFSESLYGLKSIGGVVGENEKGTVKKCHNSADIEVTSIDNDFMVGGVVGNNSSGIVLTNCYNTGTVSVKDCNKENGFAYAGGIVGFTSSTVTNCYNAGTITNVSDNTATGQIAGYGTVNNSYYINPTSVFNIESMGLLSNDVTRMVNDDGSVEKSAAEFAAGDVAYLLNGETNEGDLVWRQSLGSDNLPVLYESHPVVCRNSDNEYYNAYPIKFLNYDNSVLQILNLAQGETPSYSQTPTRPSEGTTKYTFSGWNPDITAVTGSATYIAQYTSETSTPKPEATPIIPPIVTERKLYVDYMGNDSSSGGLPDDTGKPNGNLDENNIGDKFWVGVAVDKSHDLPLFTLGIHSLEIAFEYDPDFLEPYTTTNVPEDDWQEQLKQGNFSNSNNSLWWNENQYEIISVTDTKLDTTNDREDKGLLSDRENWRMCTVCVIFNPKDDLSGAAGKRFKDLTEETKQYLLKLPFKLKKAPADTDADQNPTVLSLVRGPETLDIGSGDNGTEEYSSWEATVTDPSDAENMKTLFNFNGDVKLFGEAASISDIVPVKPKTGEETEDTIYTLSQSNQLQLEGFNPVNNEYYLSVPNETEKLRLDITSSSMPTVTVNGSGVNTSLNNQLYVTDEFTLSEVNKDVANGGEQDGFNNTVVVNVSGTSYTIHIRRLLTPKIILNPGNSPYGMIEKMSTKYMGEENGWSEDKIKKAKEEFEKIDKFAEDYVPDEAMDMYISKTTRIYYRPEVWGGATTPDLNMDRNPEAIFIYNGQSFVDPGYTVINSYGEVVENPQVTCTIKVKRMLSQGTKGCVNVTDPDADDAIETNSLMIYKNVTSGMLFSDLTSSNAAVKSICPGVYDMLYESVDPVSGQSIQTVRKVVVLFKTGDTDLDGIISPIDLNALNLAVATNKTDITGASDETNRLYLYRIMDTDNSSDISAIDINSVRVSVATNNPISLYYKELPNH